MCVCVVECALAPRTVLSGCGSAECGTRRRHGGSVYILYGSILDTLPRHFYVAYAHSTRDSHTALSRTPPTPTDTRSGSALVVVLCGRGAARTSALVLSVLALRGRASVRLLKAEENLKLPADQLLYAYHMYAVVRRSRFM